MYRLLIILLVCCGVNYSHAQTKEGMLLNYSQEDGLPSDEAYCVFKDSKGYIWISTDQGVVRHNGTKMEVIRGLPDNVVFKIREDSKGRVWFLGHGSKLAYYSNGKVSEFFYDSDLEEKISSSVIIDAFISDNDDIHVNTYPRLNFIVNINTGKIKEIPVVMDLAKATTCAINVDITDNRTCWARKLVVGRVNYDTLIINLVRKGEIVSYKLVNRRQLTFQFYGAGLTKKEDVLLYAGECLFRFFHTGGYQVMYFGSEILTMEYDIENDAVYLGLRGKGIKQVDLANFRIMRNKTMDALNNKSVTSITTDDEGGKWFTTLERGVYYRKKNGLEKVLSGDVSRVYSYKNSFLLFTNNTGLHRIWGDSSLPVALKNNENVRQILEDKEGNILVGIGNPRSESYKSHSSLPLSITGIHNKRTSFICSDGEMYFANDTILYFTLNGYALKSKYKKNEFRILFDENRKNLLPQQRGKIYIDSLKQLWHFGMNGIYAYDFGNESFNRLEDSAGLLSKGVNCIRQVPGNMYAVGINLSGLALLKNKKVIACITERQGLSSNSVRCILPVRNRIWLAMSNGISMIEFTSYNPIQYYIKNFSTNFGLNDLVIRSMVENDGNIIAATNKGIYRLNESESLLAAGRQTIPLFITKLNYYRGDTSGIGSINLPYKHNQLTIDFDAICYDAPSELKYYYRLIDDSDTGWSSLKSSQIVLANLTPGNYKLQIKAELPKYNRRSEIRELEITVEKPWWQWNLVRIGALLLFFLIVYLIYNRRVKIITRREEEKSFLQTEMAELKQVALRSQMNPHFIFNCLTSIQQLVVAGNRDEANEYLVKFSRLIRKTLELSIRSHISLAEEKEYISEYLELEQLRIPGQFDFHFNIDKDINTDTTEIPNMMLQPIVENCVRHGIKHLENRKGRIEINVSRSDGYLYCVITDNGVGRQAKASGRIFSSSRSFGMGIIEKRLAGLAGYDRGNYFIKLVDLADDEGMPAGTKVILQLPLQTRTI